MRTASVGREEEEKSVLSGCQIELTEIGGEGK